MSLPSVDDYPTYGRRPATSCNSTSPCDPPLTARRCRQRPTVRAVPMPAVHTHAPAGTDLAAFARDVSQPCESTFDPAKVGHRVSRTCTAKLTKLTYFKKNQQKNVSL
jgi:hypothetical protein